MKLTEEEQAMLDGARGPGVALAIELVTAVGRAYDAERLVPVSSVHISGVSFQNIGETGLAFLEEILTGVDSVAVPTTVNPCGIDLARADAWGLDPAFLAGQKRIVDVLAGAGAQPLLTCTPYRAGIVLAPGATVAWAESSAVSWANSMLGARTNRIGGPEAVASAVTGRTALYGLLLDGNRLPTHGFHVPHRQRGVYPFGALGLLIGRQVGGGVPLLRFAAPPAESELLAMAAAMAAAGSVALFYVEGITPLPRGLDPKALPWTTVADPFQGLTALDDAATSPPDLVAVGCPHASMGDMEEIATLLEARTVERTTWVMTSRHVRDQAREAGLAQTLERAGVDIVCDTCVVSAPLRDVGYTSVVLDSAKAALYCPSHCGVAVRFASREECVAWAVGDK